MKRLLKLLVWGTVGLVLLLVAGALVAYVFLGRIVEKAIETAGPMVTKCPVTVDRVEVRPLAGRVRVHNFVIGNPEGFSTPEAFRVDEVRVAVAPGSLLSDLIEIEEITVAGPEITYEIGRGRTNIGTIQSNVDAFLKSVSGEPGTPKPEEPAAGGKKVTIGHVKVENGQINLSGTILQGQAIGVPLPTIELSDIGKGQPVSGPQAVAEILNRILGGVLDAVSQSGKAVLDAAKELQGTVQEAGKDLKKGLGGALDGVKDIFRKDD